MSINASQSHEDLLSLLKHINSIYSPSSDADTNPHLVSTAPSTGTNGEATAPTRARPMSLASDESRRVNGYVSGYGNLVGATQAKSRLQVLFLRLKVYNTQYTEGRMTLTEYHKKNMETMKRIVYTHGIRTTPSMFVSEEPENAPVVDTSRTSELRESMCLCVGICLNGELCHGVWCRDGGENGFCEGLQRRHTFPHLRSGESL